MSWDFVPEALRAGLAAEILQCELMIVAGACTREEAETALRRSIDLGAAVAAGTITKAQAIALAEKLAAEQMGKRATDG